MDMKTRYIHQIRHLTFASERKLIAYMPALLRPSFLQLDRWLEADHGIDGIACRHGGRRSKGIASLADIKENDGLADPATTMKAGTPAGPPVSNCAAILIVLLIFRTPSCLLRGSVNSRREHGRQSYQGETPQSLLSEWC